MAKIVYLDDLTGYLDEYLDPEKVSDVSVNGLQVPGDRSVKKIAVATDASLDSFQAAVKEGCNFLFVHHGIFWNYNKEDRITPIKKEKLKFLFDQGLSLYASHLPLDLHPEVGNNISLFHLLGLQNPAEMGFYHGTPIGIMGDLESPVRFENFVQLVEQKLNDKVKAMRFHEGPVEKVAMITGQGQSGITEARQAGFDTFITGEMNHYMYYVAKEEQVNIILGGHYRTETLGPIAVGKHLKEKFGLDYSFLDFPTGL